MSSSTSTSTRHTVNLGDGLTVTVDKYGDQAAAGGSGVLLLHGGGGYRTVAGLAAALSEHAYVIVPTHPGFDGTPRPDWTDSTEDLAFAYLDLIERLHLDEVVVIGNSVGGWIAADMALRDTRGRISGLVLLNAIGIAPDEPNQIVDVRGLNPVQIGALAFHKPALRPDPSTFTDEQRAIGAANQQTLAVYAGATFTHDPKLRRRLHRVSVPVLVLWGEQDGVASVAYGQAFAEAFPRGKFIPVPEAGHFPHIERPGFTTGAIGRFVNTEVKPATT